MCDAAAIRRTVFFSGCVQGVGFRNTTAYLARRFPVTGTVRNLPDGRVELIYEAAPAVADAFLAAIRSRMEGNISDIHAMDSSAAGNFDGFRITH